MAHAGKIGRDRVGALQFVSDEIPEVERCNNGSSGSDQVAALVALIQATVHKNIPDDYMNKLMLGVKNNAPSAFYL